MSGATRQLAEFAATLAGNRLPAEVVERAKLLVLDTLGVALRSRHDAESTPALMAAVEKLGLAAGTARVVGDPAGYAPPGAALVNGTLAHSLDFDDTHATGSIHPSAPIVPAALAAAEMTGADGATTLAAIVAGYEVQIRLSLALNPKDHYDRGFHPSATCGAFGAAAAAGRVFGLSPDAIADAFGIALSQTAGTMQFLQNGAWTKRFQVGWAASSGLVAASLAREGFKGSAEAVEGRVGFLHAYAPNSDAARATAGLGSTWETMAIGVKPYPSCRYSHAPMDALIALREEHGIREDEIESVEIGVAATGIKIIGVPEEEKHAPKNAVDGQFSMPFLAAVVLRQGRMGWDDYAHHLGDPKTLELTRRARTVVDPRAEAEFPRNMAGTAKVVTKRGTFERMVVTPKGEPEAFPTAADFRAKFDGLVGPYLTDARIDRLAEAILGLDRAPGVEAMLELTRPDRKLAAAAE